MEMEAINRSGDSPDLLDQKDDQALIFKGLNAIQNRLISGFEFPQVQPLAEDWMEASIPVHKSARAT
jgi:hypothetical protein